MARMLCLVEYLYHEMLCLEWFTQATQALTSAYWKSIPGPFYVTMVQMPKLRTHYPVLVSPDPLI